MTAQTAPDYPFPTDSALGPPAEWAEFRDRCPIAKVRLASGDEATLVTRHEDVRTVLSDSRFSRPKGSDGGARVSTEESIFDSETSEVLPQLGEAHQRWRTSIMRWFTAKKMNEMRSRIEEMADHLIDDLVAAGATGDLKAAYAFQIPVWVICDMMGVPAADRDRFAHWSDQMLSMTKYTMEEVKTAQEEFGAYMAAHIEKCRANPDGGDDIIRALVAEADAAPEGEGLTDIQLIATSVFLLIAGHETTANMITKAIAMLLADRARWEALVADPEIVRGMVEELLRFDANAGFGMVRQVKEDLETGSGTIPAGTTVVTALHAANRDERAFGESACVFDPTRSPNPHLAFGAGPHSCLGQSLARVEMQVALETLTRRLPGLRPAVPIEQLEKISGLLVNGFVELPVTW